MKKFGIITIYNQFYTELQNNNMRLTKIKTLLFLLIINSMSMNNYNCVQAQNGSSDKQAIAMLKEFYTDYITEWSKMTSPVSLTKMAAIQRKYCTASLLNKINAQFKSGYVDAYPFVHAQDVDISWLKTMSFSKDLSRLNGYTVSYTDYVSKYKVITYLTVIKQGDNFKITAIR